MSDYPKILLLCSFSQSKANGITIRNLFKTWPEGRVAVAEFTDGIEEIYVEGVHRYYILGSKESRFIWPFHYLRKLRPSAAYVGLSEAPDAKAVPRRKGGLAARLKALLSTLQVQFLQKTGLAMVSRKFRISPEFEAWVRDFKPDVVYSVTGDISKLYFMQQVQERFALPLVVHVFDDYLNSRHEQTWFPVYWKRRLDKSFKSVVDSASLHLAIGDKMGAEYAEKYGQSFYGFHNPIDPELWLTDGPAEKNELSSDRTGNEGGFTFLYAGKINKDTVGPLIHFIDLVESLKDEGVEVEFKIISPYPYAEIFRLLGSRAESVYQGKVSYAELPATFRKADALLLPLDFTEATIRYIRLSMLTKATEYMISGSPIFVYAPAELAVSEYLMAHDAAYHCGNPEELKADLLEFIGDSETRERLAGNAVQRACEYHLMEPVGERLRALICKAIAGTEPE